MLKQDRSFGRINSNAHPSIRRRYKHCCIYLYSYVSFDVNSLNKDFGTRWIHFRAKEYATLYIDGIMLKVIPALYIKARSKHFYISDGHYVYDVNKDLKFDLSKLKNGKE